MDIGTDPRDELLAVTPPTKHFAELERLWLGMYTPIYAPSVGIRGTTDKWLWNESEVRRLDVAAARAVIILLKESVP